MEQLLMLHGAIGAKDQLEPLTAGLKNKYLVHAINFRGHGDASFPGNGFSISCFAEDVIAYIEQHDLKAINIFGYSMGGYVAMYPGRHYPHLISRIITLATKFHWDQTIAANEIQMLDANKILEKIALFAKTLEKRHFPNDWKIVLDKTKDMLLQLGISNKLQLKDYPNISAPCLLLLGDKDKIISADETVAVQRALPDATFKLLPGTPHPIEQVDMKLLCSSIKDFFN